MIDQKERPRPQSREHRAYWLNDTEVSLLRAAVQGHIIANGHLFGDGPGTKTHADKLQAYEELAGDLNTIMERIEANEQH